MWGKNEEELVVYIQKKRSWIWNCLKLCQILIHLQRSQATPQSSPSRICIHAQYRITNPNLPPGYTLMEFVFHIPNPNWSNSVLCKVIRNNLPCNMIMEMSLHLTFYKQQCRVSRCFILMCVYRKSNAWPQTPPHTHTHTLEKLVSRNTK